MDIEHVEMADQILQIENFFQAVVTYGRRLAATCKPMPFDDPEPLSPEASSVPPPRKPINQYILDARTNGLQTLNDIIIAVHSEGD